MPRLSYSYSDFDVFEALDGSYIVIVDGRPTRTFSTREEARKWIKAERVGQSAWRRQAKWRNGELDD